MSVQKAILLIAFFISSKLSYTQVDTLSLKKDNNLLISISGGIALPLGKFFIYESHYRESTYSGTNYAGPARNGRNAQIEAMYLFSKKLGFSISAYLSKNDAAQVGENDLFPFQSTAMGSGSTRTSYSYTTKTWDIKGISMGLKIGLYNGSRLKFRLKIAGGVQQVLSPETCINNAGDNWNMNWSSVQPYTASTLQPRLTSYSFAFNSSAELSIHLIKRFGIILSTEYFISQASFHGDMLSEYNHGTSQSFTKQKTPFKFTKNISFLCFNIGGSFILK